MEANVTLHWFVHPRWFDELGGWRRSENVKYYVEWVELAFKLWGQCPATTPPPTHHQNIFWNSGRQQPLFYMFAESNSVPVPILAQREAWE